MCAPSTSTGPTLELEAAPAASSTIDRSRRILPSGVLALTGYGIFVYGSSAFIGPVTEQAPGLSHAIVPFAAGVRSFSFAAYNLFFGQRLLRTLRPRSLVALGTSLGTAGLLLTTANVASLLGAPSEGVFVSGTGVLCGVGSGLVYMAVFQPTLAWFPERKGLVAGLLSAGQGVDSTTWKRAADPALH